jgi:ribosomal protein S27AE
VISELILHCPTCGQNKPSAEFNRSKSRRTGYQGECRICQNSRKAKWQRENRPKQRASARRWELANREKMLAHRAVETALARGHMTKPSNCQRCGEGGLIHGHHEDYSQRLDVKWLCPDCHKKEHAGQKHE